MVGINFPVHILPVLYSRQQPDHCISLHYDEVILVCISYSTHLLLLTFILDYFRTSNYRHLKRRFPFCNHTAFLLLLTKFITVTSYLSFLLWTVAFAVLFVKRVSSGLGPQAGIVVKRTPCLPGLGVHCALSKRSLWKLEIAWNVCQSSNSSVFTNSSQPKILFYYSESKPSTSVELLSDLLV